MTRTWLAKAAALGIILTLAPKPVGAQNLDPASARRGLSQAIRAEAAKLAYVETEQSRNPQALSQSPSKQARTGRTGSKARYGVALGLLGMFAGLQVGSGLDHHGDGPWAGEMIGASIGAAGGALLGVWLAGR
jgi:hypothetical protein